MVYQGHFSTETPIMAIKIPYLDRFSALLILLTVFLLAGCIAENAENGNSGDSHVQITTENLANSTPKNIIVFIGDGMGISTITAGRIFDGQSKGKKGEEHELAFDSFENVALIKTYNTNAQVPDLSLIHI